MVRGTGFLLLVTGALLAASLFNGLPQHHRGTTEAPSIRSRGSPIDKKKLVTRAHGPLSYDHSSHGHPSKSGRVISSHKLEHAHASGHGRSLRANREAHGRPKVWNAERTAHKDCDDCQLRAVGLPQFDYEAARSTVRSLKDHQVSGGPRLRSRRMTWGPSTPAQPCRA